MGTAAPGRLVYGPDRLPMEERAGDTEALHGYRPFHGIASLGLCAHPACTLEGWRDAAPLLDAQPDAAGPLAGAARECGVLSFDESLAAAAHAAREYGGGAPPEELWGVKEGHTASVWRATYTGDGGPRRVVLNVARDAAASRALEAATDVYRALAAGEPEVAAARVLGVWRLARGDAARPPVTVVAQAWVDDAHEINAVPVGPHGARQLVAVERFITDAAQPARIRSVRGRRLTPDEHARVGRGMALLMRRGARGGEGAWSVPRFVVGHGDWVWRDDGPVAVACGAVPAAAAGHSLRDAVRAAVREACGELDAEFARAVARGAAAVL